MEVWLIRLVRVVKVVGLVREVKVVWLVMLVRVVKLVKVDRMVWVVKVVWLIMLVMLVTVRVLCWSAKQDPIFLKFAYIALDMGRGRSRFGRPLCGGAARPSLLLCIKRIFFMLEGNIRDR